MAGTYTQIHIQFVFAVKRKSVTIKPEWEANLFAYFYGMITKRTHKLLTINGIENHIHILIGMRPSQSISDLVKEIKAGTSSWINSNHLTNRRFQWQEGYGAFSYSKSHVPRVILYIHKQKEHHKREAFLDEYKRILDNLGIEYDEKYLFKPPE